MLKTILRYLLAVLLFLISATAFAQNCTVNAGADRTICPGDAFVLTGNATGSFAQQAVWTQVAGPSVTVSNTTVTGGTVTATVSGFSKGQNYTFRISSKCTDGSAIYDDAVYTVSNLTVANAGPDIVSCPGVNAVTMAANAVQPGETGIWTVQGNLPLPSPVTSPNGKITLQTTGPSVGTSVYTWTITNSSGSCTSTSTVRVTNLGGEAVAAESPINVTCYSVKAIARLHASFGGNGNGQQGTWSFISGPSIPVFGDVHDNNTGVGELVGGVYKLRWTVTGPCVNGSVDVTVNVSQPTQDVTYPGGEPYFTYCDSRTSTVLDGAKPQYKNEVVQWTPLATNPAGATVSNPTSPTTTISGLDGHSAYDFLYTITNTITGCSLSGIYHIRYTTPPVITFITANPMILPCNTSQLTINYNVEGGNRTQWALVSAPPGSQLEANAGINNFTTAADVLQPIAGMNKIGTYVIRFRRYNQDALGGCSDSYKDITIVVSKSPYQANAGTSQFLACGTTSATLAGNAPQGDDSGQGQWTQVSGPNTAVIADKNLNTTAISDLHTGVYVFRWIVTGGGTDCGDSQSDVKVIVASTPTHANAGTNINTCYGTPVKLAADAPLAYERGTWSVVSESPSAPVSNIVFSNANDPNATVTGLLPNKSYTLQWKIENSCGSLTSNMTITTSGTAGPKQALAGADQCLSGGTNHFTLNANAPDAGETGTWTLLSGSPNTPSYNTTANTQTVTGAINGTYKFEWQLNRGGCITTRDTVVITIAPATTIAEINGGSAIQNVCGLGPITLSHTGTALQTGETGTWIQTAGPGGATITSPNATTTTVTGLIQGRYKFRFTISNGVCANSLADITYNISQPPTTAIAAVSGSNPISLCDATSTTLDANPITVGTGLWVVKSGPNSPHFSSLSDPKATISGLTLGTYVLTWQATNGTICPASTSDVTIVVHQSANAGPDENLCNTTATVLYGNEGSDGTWTMVSALPAGTPAVSITKNGTPGGFGNSVIVTGLTPGASYVFRYTINTGIVDGKDAGGCGNLTDDMNVTITGPPSIADAGPDQQICTNTTTTVTLAAAQPATGTGSWAIISRPNGSLATLSSETAYNATLNNLSVPGDYLLKWTVSYSNCQGDQSSNDIMRISVSAPPTTPDPMPNQPNACLGNIVLTGTTPTVGLGTWTFVPNGAGDTRTPVIDAPNSPTTTISNLTVDPANPYVFRWTISSSCSSAFADVSVTIKDKTPATAVAGTVSNLCAPSSGTASATLASTNTSLTGNDIGTWTVVSQPASSPAVTFNNSHSATATAGGLVPGDYTLRWTITNNSGCSSSSDVTFKVLAPPSVADAGPASAVYCLSSAVLNAIAPTSGTGTWSVISKPSGSPDPVFTNVNDPHATTTGLVLGNYILRWTVSNGQCADTHDDITITTTYCNIDVNITNTDNKTAYVPGATNTYTVVAANTGTADVSGTSIVYTLPAGITATWTAAFANGATGAASGSGNISQLVDLPAGASVTYTVTATVPLSFSGDLTTTATATLPSGFTDPTPANNSATDTDTENSSTDVKVLKTVLPATPSINTNVTFTISATNNGPVNANNVRVNDLLPSGYTFINASPTQGIYNNTTGVWTIGTLSNGGGAVLTVSAKVNPTGNYTNTATIIANGTDPDPSNNTSQVTPTPKALPLANNDAATTGSNTPTDINILGNDVKAADNLVPSSVTIITQPQHGTVVIDPATGRATYTPAAGYSGVDVFTYIVSDANGGTSNPATVTLTINKAPTANNDNYLTNMNTPVTVSILSNDITAGASLNPSTIVVTQQPAHGTVTINPSTGQATYTPNTGYSGTDSFVYTVKDQNGSTSNPATVTFTIPKAPTAVDDNANTDPNKPVTIDELNNDQPGTVSIDPTTVTIVTQPAHGTLIIDPSTGRITYVPNANYAGPDQFTYTVKDVSGATSNVATVKIGIADKPQIGVAKAMVSATKATNGSYDVTYVLTVGNYGITDLTTIGIQDNLAQTFAGEQFQVKSIRTLGRLKVNANYNGTSNTEMLAPGNPLVRGQTEQIELVVNVVVLTGGKTYLNQANATGTSVTGATTTDQSTDGLQPDAGGVNSSTPTPVNLTKPDVGIPEGFSPNGDGVHDKFVIENTSGRKVSLEFYNRWGNLVYRNGNYQNDWDGKSNQGVRVGEDLPEGTYYYIAVFDGKDRYVGFITLNR